MKPFDPTKPTVGSLVEANIKKDKPLEDHPREYTRAMGLQKMEEIEQVVQEVSKWPKFENKNIYFTLVINIDKLLQNQPKFILLPPRESCPTPVYKQAVWKFERASGQLHFLWDIPSKERY